MLFKNDIFLGDGIRYRLLYVDPKTDKAWIISIDDAKAWPERRAWRELRELSAASPSTNPNPSENGRPVNMLPVGSARGVTAAMKRVQDNALRILGELPSRLPDILDEDSRGPLVAEQAQKGFSRSAIYKNLRRYWVGGQTPAALLANFSRCGRFMKGVTAGRGAPPRENYETYQLTATDEKAFVDVTEHFYLKDKRLKITHAFQRLLENHYQAADSNGTLFIKPKGQRPSLKQFEYFIRTHYTLEQRLRRREGEKDFERNHRATLGTILSRCQGVGHQYEADATIADVFLVAAADRKKIIGKPTIYFIIDRKSRLITGWYVGLENASWVCAMQALLTISADKRAICNRYGVEYQPSDWPAHEIFPAELIADRGELMHESSDRIADFLSTRIVNLPSQRPEKKPIVECQFKLLRAKLQDGTPGFDPPENAKRRMGRHYEKDACLTLDEFTAMILHAIIEHNRKPLKDYELSLPEIADGVEPSPISIWVHDITARAGALTRYRLEDVRLALLPRGEATVSEDGILFQGCFYTCSEAVARGWFVAARKRRMKVMVSYDSRLVDSIYVHDPARHGGANGGVYTCVLTQRSDKYQGLSFAEVKAHQFWHAQLRIETDQRRIQTRADFHAATQPIIDKAKRALAASSLKVSRTARRADIKDDRQRELRKERQEVAAVVGDSQPFAGGQARNATAQELPPARGRVVSLPAARAAASAHPQSTNLGHQPEGAHPSVESAPAAGVMSLAEKARAMRERMRNG